MFSQARGHMCLEHAKKLSSSRFSDGYRKLIPSTQEFIAFLPKKVRHVAAVDLLDRLRAAGQAKGHTYLATAGEGGSFHVNANGFFDARWGSSFEDVDPGYATFLNN